MGGNDGRLLGGGGGARGRIDINDKRRFVQGSIILVLYSASMINIIAPSRRKYSRGFSAEDL